jgi:hypothetical protein
MARGREGRAQISLISIKVAQALRGGEAKIIAITMVVKSIYSRETKCMSF